MKSNKISAMLILIFSLSVAFSVNLTSTTTQGYKGVQPVIIIDNGHSQVFNYTLMQSAVDILETKFDADVIIHEEDFTLTNIRGADLLILPAPSINTESDFIDDVEQQAVVEFYEDGGSVLYLANPYFFEEEYRNYSSSNINLNSLMGSIGEEDTYGSLSFSSRPTTLMNDFNNRYNDERFIYINETTMDIDHSVIQGFVNEDPVDELLTYSTYIQGFSDRLINTSTTTYEVNDDGEVPFGGTKAYAILAADSKFNGRGLSCGSSIMFSDLQITENETTTWYEAYDNALLWENMIAWLLQDIPDVTPKPPLPPYGLFVIILVSTFFLLMVAGSVFFTIGRESKKVEVSEILAKMRERAKRRKKEEQEIDEAYYAESDEKDDTEVSETVEDEEIEEEEVDMKSISEELKKKPPKTRSRSERRRRRR